MVDVTAFNAAKGYGAARRVLATPAPKAPAAQPDSGGFSPLKAVSALSQEVAKSESAAAAFVTGKADPHSVVEALASAQLAVETAVTLRNRVVEAYQELLRIPV